MSRRNVARQETPPPVALPEGAAVRVLIAKLAAHERWSRCSDPSAATAPARKAFADRFERQVDPTGVLEPHERARRAMSARKAFSRVWR